jgi:hypothetical protein
LPTGITWVKNPNALKGGGYGCVEFTGTTTDPAGIYNLTAVGTEWVHINAAFGLVNEDTMLSDQNLTRLPQFGNFYLVVDSVAGPLMVSTTAGRNVCFGDTAAVGSLTATATGGSLTALYTFAWSTGATTNTITGLHAGTYYVTVTSGVDTVVDTAMVALDPSAITLATTTDSGSTGANGTVNVTASGGVPPYTYRWTPGGALTASADSLPAGPYRVTVTDSFGCRATDTATVKNLCASLVAVTTDSGSTGTDGTASVSATGGYPPYTYVWNDSATTDSITGLAPGTYRVTVTDSKGCASRGRAVVANLTGIGWLTENAPKISMFPNPANGSISVVISSNQAVTGRMEVVDMTGRLVYSAPLSFNSHYNVSLNTSSFSTGVYTLQILSDNQGVHQRFEVTH